MNHLFHEETRTSFNYPTDLSGNVIVQVAGGPEVEIPGEALLALIAEYVRTARITAIEQASAEELLLEMWGIKT